MIEHGPYYSFNGHSSHVKNVCWTADDARVISAGSGDRSMLQWTVNWSTRAGACAPRSPRAAPRGPAPTCARARAHAGSPPHPPPGYTGYRPPDAAAGDDAHGPPPLFEPAAAALDEPAPPPPPLPPPPGGATDAAAAEQRRRDEQAKAVAALEQQMLAIEQQQQALRAELSRLKR